jgi:predicted Zn-dependent peptidase
MIKFKIFAATCLMLLGATQIEANDNKPVTHEFTVEGIHVILRESVKGTVSARLFVRGGTENYDKALEGVENMALSLAMESGPTDMTKESFNAATESVGARMGASSGYDYGNISLTCVKMYWDESWDLYSRTIVSPAFRENEFLIFQEQMVTAAKQSISNPDARLSELNMTKTWAGTNYEKLPSGSVESLSALTLQDLQDQYKKVVTKKNTFLVVVGDITKEDLMAKIKASLAQLPEGTESAKLYAKGNIQEGLYVEDRDIETNYIMGSFDAPQKGTTESTYNALAMSILGDRFFEELRTKRSLSYSPQAFSSGRIAHPTNSIYISTTNPEASLAVMVDELDKVKTTGFTEKELEGKKQEYLTRYFMGIETNSSISMTLGVNEITGGWERSDSFTEDVLKVNVKEINEVMKRYGNTINWTYLGKEEMVKPEDFRQPVQPTKKMKN